MACFVVSAAAGIGVAVARHAVKHHEKKKENAGVAPKIEKFGSDTKWSKKLAYLELMLFAGMLGILVAVWGIGVLVSDYIKFKRRKALPEAKKEGAK